jgi:hypothetical protein
MLASDLVVVPPGLPLAGDNYKNPYEYDVIMRASFWVFATALLVLLLFLVLIFICTSYIYNISIS